MIVNTLNNFLINQETKNESNIFFEEDIIYVFLNDSGDFDTICEYCDCPEFSKGLSITHLQCIECGHELDGGYNIY